jgi:hypothetical protein
MTRPPEAITLKQYTGELTVVDAANAIHAAKLNARDLLETAEMLHTLKRFPHSMLFSTLALKRLRNKRF